MMSLREKKKKKRKLIPLGIQEVTHMLCQQIPHFLMFILASPQKKEQGSNKRGRETGIKKGKKMG